MKILFAVLIWLLICCGPIESPRTKARDTRVEAFFQETGYNLKQPDEKYLLPAVLSEVSGLSFYKRNVLACVQDELGTIFLYDLKRKEITKRMKFAKNGDFEGLAVVDKSIYVVKSNGDIYHYLEAVDSTDKIETPLSSSNDVEGLAYDAQNQRLLLACKESAALKGEKQSGKALYSYYLNGDFNAAPAYIITEKQVTQWNQKQSTPLDLTKRMKAFKPSGVAIHPKTNEIFIVAYSGSVLIVLSPQGSLLHFVPISQRIFKQPEGICFAPNGDLMISNESKGGKANILRFKCDK